MPGLLQKEMSADSKPTDLNLCIIAENVHLRFF